VRPPSSTSEPSPGGLFDGVLTRGGVREAVGDLGWLQAMLDFEAALALAQARAGLIPAEDADAIARACHPDAFDVAALGAAAADTGNPVVPLVRVLTAAVEGRAAGHVHRGATSQDTVDTAVMLVAHRALGPLLEDLTGAADAAAALADRHRATLMAGRTLLQHALPITFGLKAAGWMAGLDAAASRLAEVRRTRLAIQLGGAAGTLASLGADGPTVVRYVAEELGLAEPILPWHTERTRIAELAGALGAAAGASAKLARDVILLAQTEVAEVREGTPGRGGSSTLPNKRNPIAAVSAVACAERAPGLVATLLASMGHEHERAAGPWHAEWLPLADLLRSTGSAVAWLRDCLDHLEVDAARMRANLDMTGGLLLAERVTTALAPTLGRLPAHELVERAARQAIGDRRRSLRDALLDIPEVTAHMSREEIEDALDPARYLGSANAFVDRALLAHRTMQGAAGA
jgi:3-carboxy-cis,cis-muconate cycloisomerase